MSRTSKRTRFSFFLNHKIRWMVISCFLIFLIGLFTYKKDFSSYVLGSCAKSYVHHFMKKDLSYSTVNWEKGSLWVNNLAIAESRDKAPFLQVDEAALHFSFHPFSQKKLHIDIKAYHPSISLNKHASLPGNKAGGHQKKESWIDFQVQIFDGHYAVCEEESIIQEGGFSFEKKYSRQQKCVLFDPDTMQETMNVAFFQEGDEHLAYVEMEKASLEKLADVAKFFLPETISIDQLKGVCSGSLMLGLKDLSLSRLSCSLKMEDLLCVDESKDLDLSCKKLEVEAISPIDSASTAKRDSNNPKDDESSLMLSFLPKNLLLRLSVEEGAVSSVTTKDSSVEMINGYFYYNASVGPKWDFTALANDKEFLFKGRGYLQSPVSNWLEGKLCINQNDHDDEAIAFSVKEGKGNRLSILGDIQNLQASEWNLFSSLFQKTFPVLEEWKISGGVLTSQVQALFENKNLIEFQLKDFHANQFVVSNTSFPFVCGWQSLCGNIQTDLKTISGLDAQVDLEGSFVKIQTPKELHELMSGLKSQIEIQKGVVLPSECSFESHTMQGKVQMSGSLDNMVFEGGVEGNSAHIAELFSMDIYEEKLPYNAKLILKTNSEKTQLSGESRIGEEEKLSWNVEFLHSLIFHMKDPLAIKKYISSFSAEGEKINLDRCFQVWPILKASGHNLKGLSDISARLDNNLLQLSLRGHQLFYGFNDFNISFEDFEKETTWILDYDLSSDHYTLVAPNLSGKCFFSELDKTLNITEAKGELEDNCLTLSSIKANMDQTNVTGDVVYDFSGEIPQIHLQCTDISGPIPHFPKISSQMGDPFFFSYTGNLKGSCDLSFAFLPKEVKTEGCLVMGVSGISIPCHEGLSIQQGQAQIYADFSAEEFYVENLQAQIEMPHAISKKTLTFRAPVFQGKELKESKWFYDFRVEDDIHEICRMTGDLEKNSKQTKVNLYRDYSHFLDMPLRIENILFDQSNHLKTAHLIIDSDFQQLYRQCEFFLQTGLLPLKGNLSFLPRQDVMAKFHGDFSYNDTQLDYRILASDINFQTKPLSPLEITGKHVDKTWFFDDLSWEGFSSSFQIAENFQLENFSLSHGEEIQMTMEGFFKNNQFEGQIKDVFVSLEKCQQLASPFITLPVPVKGTVKGGGCVTLALPTEEHSMQFDADWDVESESIQIGKLAIDCKTPFFIQQSLKDGMMFQGLDLSFAHDDYDFSGINLKVHHLLYQAQLEKWLFQEAKLQLPCDVFHTITQARFFQKIPPLEEFLLMIDSSANFEHPIDILTNIECAKDFSTCKAEAIEGDFSVNGNIRHFKDLSFSFAPTSSDLGFSILYNDRYYTMNNTVDWADQFFVKTMVYEKGLLPDDPLTLIWSWDEKWGLRIATLKGHFCGLTATFYEEDQINLSDPPSMLGSLKLDFTKAAVLLPKEVQLLAKKLKLGKGFEISGRLKQTPEETEFVGSFMAKKFEVGGYEFKTLYSKLQYCSGQMMIEDFELSDQAGSVSIPYMTLSSDKSLFLPLLEIKELRPSLLKPTVGEREDIQPLVIRNLRLEDLRGSIDDKRSLTGKGSLDFINTFKRDYSVLDIPSEVIGRLVGLDLELLVPVRGGLDYEIRDGKWMITKVKKTFSEGKRSKFFLADGDVPYVDFNGNVNIHIKMKQYVLFKLTENFILSLEGTLEKPHFTMRKKKSFYSLLEKD